MYIYDDFVVNTTKHGNFKVEMYSDDEDTRTTVRISRKEIEFYESSNVDPEMIVISVAIIKFMRMNSFKVIKDEFEGVEKDITLSENFKRKFLQLLKTGSIEYLIEKFKDMKYSEMTKIFKMDVSDIKGYLNI